MEKQIGYKVGNKKVEEWVKIYTKGHLTELSDDIKNIRLTLNGLFYESRFGKDEGYERFLKDKEKSISKLKKLMDTFINEIIEWSENN